MTIKVNLSVGVSYCVYNERKSKNCRGGLSGRHNRRNSVKMFENSEDPANCPVALLKMYLERRPAGVDFYLTQVIVPKSEVWYKRSCWDQYFGQLHE